MANSNGKLVIGTSMVSTVPSTRVLITSARILRHFCNTSGQCTLIEETLCLPAVTSKVSVLL